MKCKKIRYLVIILVIVMIGLYAIFYCPHKVTYTKLVKEATCFELGQIDTLCKRCDTVLVSNTIERTVHTFGKYKLTVEPSASGPGLEVRICSVCLAEEKREYYCPHDSVYTELVKEATCIDTGQIDTICAKCKMVLQNNIVEKTAHNWKRWTYVKYATPFESGERYKCCKLCGTELRESYTISNFKNNSIYITGTDIQNTFTISTFSQSAVDRYDIVYTEESVLGANDPFILGHNYNSLGVLYQTDVGDYVYLYINGVIETYKVIVSEYGVMDYESNDIIGQTTGTSIWHNYGCKTLHMYTCYGHEANGRWIVLARKIE